MIDGRRLGASLLSGALLAVISAPLDWHALHWFSLVPLFWALREEDPRGNALLGYLSGFASVYACFYWLTETVIRFSNLPGALAIFTLLLYSAVFALPYALVFGLVHPLRRRFGAAWVGLVPALQVANEYLTPVLFPYNQGSPQYGNLWVFQLASVTGVYGLSFLVFLSNACLAEIVYGRREGRWSLSPILGFVPVIASVLVFGAWRLRALDEQLARAPVLQVAMLQESLSMKDQMRRSLRAELESWIAMTRKVVPLKPDLVIWPEGAAPYNPFEGGLYRIMSTLAIDGGFAMLVGSGTREELGTEAAGDHRVVWYNSVYYFDREGQVRGRYDKVVPVPFGEYLPFADTFPWLRDLIQGPGSFRAGREPVVIDGGEYRIAAPICYEAILPRVVRKLKDADLFVNVTNDAWFGATAAAWQHPMLALGRAAEFGRPLVRTAYTGVNYVVEPTGRIVYETAPFQEIAQVIPVRMGRFDTIYGRFGDWFAWLCLAASTVAVVRVARRRAA